MSRAQQPERGEMWRQRVAQQIASGRTVRAFCREQNLSEYSFYAWRRRLGAAAEKTVRFALVETATAATETDPPGRRQFELILGSGERLRIPAEAGALRLVLSVLREHGQAGR